MFPPIVSASPPPSDDELSGDEGEELGVADSSFDITGLSQKLPVCLAQNHKPVAVSDQDSQPDPLTRSLVTVPTSRLSSDEWGEFDGGPMAANATAGTSLEFTVSGQDATDTDKKLSATHEVSKAEITPPEGVTTPAPEPSIFSDSDSEGEEVGKPQLQVPNQKSDVGSLTLDGKNVKPDDTLLVEEATSMTENKELHKGNDKMMIQTTIQRNGIDEPSKVADVADSEDGDFGSFSAATENDKFGGWSEPVIHSTDTAMTELVPANSPQPTNGEHQPENKDSLQLPTEGEASVPQPDQSASKLAASVSNIEPPDGDSVALTGSNGLQGRLQGDADLVTSQVIVNRAPSTDDFGDFAAPGEFPDLSAPAKDTDDSSSVTDDAAKAIHSSESVNVESSTVPSPKCAKLLDDSEAFANSEAASDDPPPSDEPADFSIPSDNFGDFAVSTADLSIPADDFGDFSAHADDFGDFSAPAGDFGNFAEPSDDFCDFAAPGESSGDAWPPDSAGGGGGGSAGFADFGAVFATPAEGDSVGTPLEAAGQLADPADLSDDDFGEYEDFQAPVAEEPALITDEQVSVLALLCRLFPLGQEEQEPAAVPLDASGVWYQLREPDSTAALQYRWSGCRAYTALLHALRVDASNIINFGGWGSRPGRFACALDSEPIQPMKCAPMPESASLDHSPSQQQSTAAVSEVPPAAFDWNSSGLKNPLEPTGPEAYGLLDLDVFDTDMRPVAASSSFLSCLERELLSQEEPASATLPSQAGSDSVYGRLMAQTAGPALSGAASRVLTRLPDIDFMQAKVLMFPVRGE